MKLVLKIMIINLVLMIALSLNIKAQNTPPDMPGGHGSSGDAPGGGAPIASGLTILISLGIAYTGKTIYYSKEQSKLP